MDIHPNKNRLTLADQIYGYLAEDEDARVCKDIPDSACHEQPRAFMYQLIAQTLTAIGDTLISPRLVLAWILSALYVPAYFVAMLVPVRESLSLLPQLFIAQRIREQPLRKYYWVYGSVVQGLALLAMLPVIYLAQGFIAGVCIISLLAIFSLARGVCSVAAKDVLGKTISKSRRGRLSGSAAAAAGLVTVVVAMALLLKPVIEQQGVSLGTDIRVYLALVAAAAVAWFFAAMFYARVPEVVGATSGGANAFSEALNSLSLLRDDPGFREFVVARALLISTAFAIPYLVVLIQQSGKGDISNLGALMLADGAAGLLSGNLWGRMSDSRAHLVMALAAAISIAAMVLAVILFHLAPGMLALMPVGACLLFVSAVAHKGARVGRKTYLVDMADSENRAQYTAVSNTVIGVFLFLGAGLGVIDTWFGTSTVLLFLSAVGVVAIWKSAKLAAVSGV